MSGNQRERMSSVDTAWLRMDRPSNLMMISGVLILRERVSFARLKRRDRDRFLRFERFRQRPVQTPAGASWETDDDFDIDASRASRRTAGPRRQGGAARRFVSALASHAARSRAAAVAVPPGRRLRRRQRAGRAHPPLLRRRHRADPGDAVDHRRRSRGHAGEPGAAAAERARGPTIARRADGAARRRDADARGKLGCGADREGRRRSGTTRRSARGARRPGQRR